MCKRIKQTLFERPSSTLTETLTNGVLSLGGAGWPWVRETRLLWRDMASGEQRNRRHSRYRLLTFTSKRHVLLFLILKYYSVDGQHLVGLYFTDPTQKIAYNEIINTQGGTVWAWHDAWHRASHRATSGLSGQWNWKLSGGSRWISRWALGLISFYGNIYSTVASRSPVHTHTHTHKRLQLYINMLNFNQVNFISINYII